MLGKLADTCVVHLTPDIISLAVSSTASSGVQVWADVPQRAHFLEYRIESRAEGNRITFFATVENLQRALKSASAPQVARTQVKLTRRVQGGPTLTFEITLLDSNVRRAPSASRNRPADRDRVGRAPQVLVSHDVPLRIVQDAEVSPRRPLSRLPPPSTRRARPAQELHSYTEPAFRDDTATLSIVLGPPDLRALKNVVERMKVFSDYVQLHACEKGGSGPASESAQLQLAVEKDHLVTITTTFAKLVRFRPGQEHAIVVDPAASRCSTCAVDGRAEPAAQRGGGQGRAQAPREGAQRHRRLRDTHAQQHLLRRPRPRRAAQGLPAKPRQRRPAAEGERRLLPTRALLRLTRCHIRWRCAFRCPVDRPRSSAGPGVCIVGAAERGSRRHRRDFAGLRGPRT